MKRVLGGWMAGLAVAGLVLSGCADTTDSNEDDESGSTVFENGMVGVSDDSGEPTAGGTLEVVTYSEARSLDPTETIATGSSGGSEMGAVYDLLMRYDWESNEYVPQLAESMEPNEDHSVWTMELREGVTFSDGTPLDAAAVIWSIERYVTKGGSQGSVWQSNVEKMEATDDLSLTITLTEPWPGFEYLLASGPGMVVAKASDKGGEFTPIGAGPFTFDHYSPQEELVLDARGDYWGGAPNLDSLRFFTISAEPGRLDVLKSDEADVAYLREPKTAQEALDEGMGGYMEIGSMSRGLLLNHREGAATADPRIRQALMHAIDFDVVNQKTADGKAIMHAGIFSDLSKWSLETEPLTYDPAKAKTLLAAAKADGYDGKISFKGVATVSAPTGVILQALLETVGFEVSLDYVSNTTDLVSAIFVKQDYDMAIWGFGIPDGAVYPELYGSYHSESTSNVGASSDSKLDALIDQLKSTVSEEDEKALLEQIQQQWNVSVPAVPLGAAPEFNAWGNQVHGIVPSVDSVVLYGGAWKDQ